MQFIVHRNFFPKPILPNLRNIAGTMHGIELRQWSNEYPESEHAVVFGKPILFGSCGVAGKIKIKGEPYFFPLNVFIKCIHQMYSYCRIFTDNSLN